MDDFGSKTAEPAEVPSMELPSQCDDAPINDMPYGMGGDSDHQAVEVGQRDYSEKVLCHASKKGGLTLKGQINLGGQMEITYNNVEDNRVTNKNVTHHHGDVHQHTHNQYIKEGDIVHHYGDTHQTQHLHYGDSEAGYAQIKDQSKLAVFSDDSVFVETWAFRAAIKLLGQCGVLLLHGPSGSGKTCTGHALLRHYISLGYIPLILHRFEEWRAHVGGDRKQVILLEHVFGKDQFQQAVFLDWHNAFSTMMLLAESGKCVIIITASDAILDMLYAEHGPVSLLSHSLNLADSSACLLENEKRQILKKHLMKTENTISETVFEEIVSLTCSHVLFAAQCKKFAESSSDNRELKEIFTSSEGEVFGACGSGPKVFVKISPDIIQKSLLKMDRKVGHWGTAFLNTKQDVYKAFGDGNWTTHGTQVNTHAAEINTENARESAKGQPIERNISCDQYISTYESYEVLIQFQTACKNGDLQSVLTLLLLNEDLSIRNNIGFNGLHFASLTGNADIVKALIDHKYSVDVMDKKYWTPLHVACFAGHFNVTELLINSHANLEVETFDGMRALHIACRYGHTNIVQLLLQNGAVIEAKTKSGLMAYPLHVAAFYGHVDIVKLLIKFQARIDSRDCGGWLPLHYACQEGHLKVVAILIASAKTGLRNSMHLQINCHNGHIPFVRSLLQCGIISNDSDGKSAICRFCFLSNKLALKNLSCHHICPDQPAKGNVTGLFLAAQNGHCDIAKALLEAGACTEVEMPGGWTPLLVASYKGHVSVADLLLRFKSSVDSCLDGCLLTSLHLACLNGHKDIVDVLLRHGASPNPFNTHGKSPLHLACSHGHCNILPSLLMKVKESYTDSALAYSLLLAACESGSAAVFLCLIEWIPDIVLNCMGSSLLHDACKIGNNDFVHELLQHDFPVNTRSDSKFCGSPPLHVACSAGHTEIVQMLIEHGAAVNEKTSNEGNTALHVACGNNHIEITRMLLQDGSADPEIQNKFGQTPLHIGAGNGFPDIVSLLVSVGANVNIQDVDGETPLFSAREKSSVVAILLDNNADANIPTTKGETLLHHAYNIGNEVAVLKILNKMDQEARDACGRTALLKACQAKKNRVNLVKHLLDSGVNVDAADDLGMTPIRLACSLGDVDLLYLLIQHGARVNGQNKDSNTLLHDVSIQGQSQLLDTLVFAGADINQINNDGNTPLHLACAHLHPKVVKYLLEHGANANIKNKERLSPSNLIQSMNVSESVSHVQSASCLPSNNNRMQGNRSTNSPKSEEERRRLTDARTEIMLTFIEFSQRCLEQSLTPLNVAKATEPVTENCETRINKEALQEGEVIGDTRVSPSERLAAEKKVDIEDKQLVKEYVGFNGGSEKKEVLELPVKQTVREGETMQNKGLTVAKPKTKESMNETVPLINDDNSRRIDSKESMNIENPDFFKQEGNSDLKTKMFLTKDMDSSLKQKMVFEERLLHDSPAHEEISVVRSSFIEESASCFHMDCFYGNALCAARHLMVTKDIKNLTESGKTVLHYACAGGQSDIVFLLLQYQANFATTDCSGQSSLHLATFFGHLDTVDLLLLYGADVNATDNEQKTALHLASSQGHDVIAAVLLAHGSNIWAQDSEGRTAVHLAASNGHAMITSVLLHQGADIDITDSYGNTPLVLAYRNGHRDVCIALLNLCSNLELQNQNTKRIAKSLMKSGENHLLDRIFDRRSYFQQHLCRKKQKKRHLPPFVLGMTVFISAFLFSLIGIFYYAFGHMN